MKKNYLFTIIALIVLATSCKKDNSIGANLLPSDDLLNANFTDTFSIETKTLADTFLRTDKMTKNYLGVINDPQFGFQQASIVMELDRPSSVFDDTLGPFIVDSAILFLKYNFVYGDTLVDQSFTVSTINSPINETQAYYSNNSTFTAGTFLGSLNNYLYTPTRNPVSTTTTDSIGTTRLMRIKLDNSVIQSQIMNLSQSVKRDSLLFKNAFNGIRIENSNTSGKAMTEIDLNSTYSNITIFYKNKYGVAQVSKLFPNLFRVANGAITQQTNSINLFSNSLSSTIQNIVTSSAQNDSVNYMLGQGGTLIKVSLPTLANLGRVAVNKAVLQVTQIIPNSDKLQSPITIVLLKRKADGELQVIPTSDLLLVNENINYIPEGIGIIDSFSIDNLGNKLVRYSINVSKYIQNIYKGLESNSDLYIATRRTAGIDVTKNLLNTYAYNYSYLPNRLIFAGSKYSDTKYRMKLNLTYTLIK